MWGASSLWAKSRTVSRIARSSSVRRSSIRRKSWDISAPLPVGLALLVERGVELRVVVGGHQQGLGHRVELHGRPERHVELACDEGLGLLQTQGWPVGEAPGQGGTGVVEIVGELGDQAVAVGGLGVDRVAEQEGSGGGAR